MLISAFVFIGWVFCFLFLLPLWVFREFVECILPVLLAHLSGVFMGSAFWCWRLGFSSESGDGDQEVMACRIHRRMDGMDEEALGGVLFQLYGLPSRNRKCRRPIGRPPGLLIAVVCGWTEGIPSWRLEHSNELGKGGQEAMVTNFFLLYLSCYFLNFLCYFLQLHPMWR